MTDLLRRPAARGRARRDALQGQPDYATKVLRVTMLGVAASAYPITLLSASIPRIATDLHTTDSATAWVVTAPLIAFAVGTPIAGKLGDLHGHRRVFLTSYTLATILAFATSFAWDIGSLIVLRTLSQGASAAAGPSAMAIIISVFPVSQRAKALGAWAGVTAASPAIGVLIGGPLVDTLGWRSLFVIQGIIAAVATVVAVGVLPETVRKAKVRFDVPGAVTLSATLGFSLFAVNRGPEWGWDHHLVVTGLIVGPIMAIAFTFVERRSESPLLPLELLSREQFSLPIVTQLAMQAGYMGTLVAAPLYLDRVFDLGTTAIGLVIIPRPLAFAYAAWYAGRSEENRGRRAVLFFGTILLTASLVLLGVAISIEVLPLVIFAILLVGLGNGAIRPSIATAVASSVDETDIGVASGSLNMVSQVGAAVGISVFTGYIGESASTGRFLTVHLISAALASIAIVTGARFTRDTTRPPVST